MPGQEVTDPALLAQLNGVGPNPAPPAQSVSGQPVTDPAVLAQLNGGQPIAPASPRISQEDLNSHVLSMTKNGASAADIKKYMTDNGWSTNAAGEHALGLYEAQRVKGLPYQVGTVQADNQPIPVPGVDQPAQADVTKPVIHANVDPVRAAIIGAGDTVLLGNLDEITGGLQAGVHSLMGQGSFSDLYPAYRDQNRAILRGLEQDNPWSLNAGRIAGGFAMPGGALINGGKDATIVGNIGRAALQGGAYGQGSSEADTLGGQASDTLKGAGIGGAGGALVHGIGGALTAGGQKTVAALRQLGITPTPGQIVAGKVGARVEDWAGKLFNLGENTARQNQYNQLERNVLQNVGDAHGFAPNFPENVPTSQLPDYAIGHAQSVADNMSAGAQGSVQAADSAAQTAAAQAAERATKTTPPTSVTGAQMIPMQILPELAPGPRKQLMGMFADAVDGVVSNYSPQNIEQGLANMQKLAQDPRLDQILSPNEKAQFIHDMGIYGDRLTQYGKDTFPGYYTTQSNLAKTQSTAQNVADQANQAVAPAKEGFQVIKDAKEIAALRTGKANEPYTAADIQMANQYTPEQVRAHFAGGQLPEPSNRSWAAGQQADLITQAFGKNQRLAAPDAPAVNTNLLNLITALGTHGASVPYQVIAKGLYSKYGQGAANWAAQSNANPSVVNAISQSLHNLGNRGN